MGTRFLHAWKSNGRVSQVLFLHCRVGHGHVSEDEGQVFILAVSFLQEIHWYLLQWTGKVLQTLLVTFHGLCRAGSLGSVTSSDSSSVTSSFPTWPCCCLLCCYPGAGKGTLAGSLTLCLWIHICAPHPLDAAPPPPPRQGEL